VDDGGVAEPVFVGFGLVDRFVHLAVICVPEPASAMLVILGGLGILARRRRRRA
jgi:hypothetical protein